ncbi:MAG: hypothetical protein N4A71_07045 [Carboxylicivirga sp.]|nr:hypothetical protein [Carboxylicivirga sp.]
MNRYLLIVFLVYLTFSCKAQDDCFVLSLPESNQVLHVNSEGQILKTFKCRNGYDAWQTKDGYTIACNHFGIKVFDSNDSLMLNYQTDSEVFSCQPLKKQRILIGECSAGRLIEIDYEGKIVNEVKLSYKVGGHVCFRSCRKTSKNTYLVAHYGDKTVREYNGKGKVINEFERPNHVYAAERTSDGRTIISDQFMISVYNKKNELVWEWNAEDHPELGVYHLTGFELLPSNELLVCNWLGHYPLHKGIPMFSVDFDKNITWKYSFDKAISPTEINLIK